MAANVNNYIAAGNAAVKNSLASLAAARDNSPKYDEIAKQGIEARTKEKIAAMKADVAVEKAKVETQAELKTNKIITEAKQDIAKSNRKTRFAGKVAAAGAAIATTLMPGPKIIKPTKTDYSDIRAKLEASQKQNAAKLEEIRNTPIDGTYFKEQEGKKGTSTAQVDSSSFTPGVFVTGKSGIGTGPHLHAGVYDTEKGDWINPTGLYEQYITGPQGQALNTFGMTSGYGPRPRPTAGASTNHRGVDWGTPLGTRLNVNLPEIKGAFGRRYDHGGGGGWMTGYQLSPTLELHLMHGQRLAGE